MEFNASLAMHVAGGLGFLFLAGSVLYASM